MLSRAVTLEIVRGVWLALGLVWGVAYFNTKRTEVRQPRGSLAAYGLLLMVSFALLAGALPLGETRLLPQQPELRGLTMVIAGAGLAIWSRLVLARNWSGAITLKTDHELVERGPYRFVRHPIYAGLILMFLGTALVRGPGAGVWGAHNVFPATCVETPRRGVAACPAVSGCVWRL